MGKVIKMILTIIISIITLILIYDYIVIKYKPILGCCSCCDKSEKICITSCCSCLKPIILNRYVNINI